MPSIYTNNQCLASKKKRRTWQDPVILPMALLVGLIVPLALPWASGGLVLGGMCSIVCIVLPRCLRWCFGFFSPNRERCKRVVGGIFARVNISDAPFILLIMGLLLSGMVGVEWSRQQLPSNCERVDGRVEGIVNDFPAIEQIHGQTRQRFSLQVKKLYPIDCRAPKQLDASIWQDTPKLNLGDRIVAEIKLLPPGSQWNPGIIPDQVFSLVKKEFARATVSNVKIVEHDIDLDKKIRQRLVSAIETIDAQPENNGARAKALLAALVVGKGSAISRDDWARFQRLGLSHVLIISGLHIGLVFGLVFWLTKCMTSSVSFGLFSPRIHVFLVSSFTAAIAMMAAFGYAMLAGFAIPTQRALLMLGCVVLATQLGWRINPIRILFFAVVVVVAWDPFAVLGRSLWMSAWATGILIVFSKPVASWCQGFLWRRVIGVVLLQVILVLSMAPVTLFWFDQLSIAGVLCNLLFVAPIAFGIVPLALLGVIWQLLAPLTANYAWLLALRGLEWLIPILERVDQLLSGVSVLEFSFSFEQLIQLLAEFLLNVLFGLVTLFSYTPEHLIDVFNLADQQAAIAEARNTYSASLTILDVGQGLAVVWQSDERTLVYDTGAAIPGVFSQTEKVLIPVLRQRGVEHIDTLVISHADTDHSGGLEEILAVFPVKLALGYGGESCRVGHHFRWSNDTRFTVINGVTNPVDSDNASSCVLLIEHKSQRFLLAGDIPVKRERELIRYWREKLQADVLLVGHHGSNTSTARSFLKWVRPRWAVISAARANRFGHPAPEVLTRLEVADTEILNTAEDGAITYLSDGDDLAGDVDRLDGNSRPANMLLKLKIMRDGTHPYWLSL